MDDDAFLKSSEIFVLAPQDTEAETHDLFAEANLDSSSESSLLTTVQQRSLLYFDELLSIYIALRTPLKTPSELHKLSDRLSISLELRSKGIASSDLSEDEDARLDESNQLEYLIWNGTLVATEEPILITPDDQGSAARAGQYMVAIWECKALLNRPQIQLHRPVIVFNATAALQPSGSRTVDSVSDPYLPDCQPVPENILAPLSRGFPAGTALPSLPSTRLHRIRPLDADVELVRRTLMVHVPEPFPALPALSSRLRHHQTPEITRRPTLLLSLDTVLAPFSSEAIEVSHVKLESARGNVEDLGAECGPKLPLQCRTKDNLVFLYRLSIDDISAGQIPADLSQTVVVTIYATVLVTDTCRPEIRMQWTTVVDLTAALRPANLIRPLKVPQDQTTSDRNSTTVTVNAEHDNTAATATQQEATIRHTEIVLTFSAPQLIRLREQFNLEIFVVNKTNLPRRLTLKPFDHSSTEGQTVRPKHEAQAQAFLGKQVADANIGEEDLQAIIKAKRTAATDIVSLDSQLELPTLDQGACYATRLRLMPLSSGHVQLGGLEVRDELSSTYYRTPKLLDILVVE